MDRRKFLTNVGAAVASARALSATLCAEAPAQPRFRVIDTHLHVFNTELQGKNGVPDYIKQPATVEAALAAMDFGGVAKAFLISYAAADVAVQIRQRGVDPETIRDVVNKEYQFRCFNEHRDRFYWFTDHVDPNRPSYLDDLQRDFEIGASGVKLLPWFHGYLADHPGFIKVYDLCRKHRKPVILDVSWWYFHLNPLYRESAARQQSVKSMADYARLLAPVFREFADVPFSLAHAGTAARADDYYDIFPFIADHPNVSCDVAAATDYSAAWLERWVDIIGASKIMYGTDWPYWTTSGAACYRRDERRWGVVADGCPRLTAAQKQQILADNAERFARFELPMASDERAAQLHQRAIVIAVHDHRPITDDIPLMSAGGVTAKVFNIGVDVDIGASFKTTSNRLDGWKAGADTMMDNVRKAIDGHSDRIRLILSAADILAAKRDGKLGIMLGVEGGKLLQGDIANLHHFYRRGLRELQVRWAVPNPLVETDELTPFGAEVVRECQKLGIIVDTTHIPQRAFDQIVEISQRPVIVSHGTAAELGAHRVASIAKSRGVIGIHFYSSYLGERPRLSRALDAIDQLVSQAGVETVALGIDFFPTDGPWRDFQNAQGTKDVSWAIPDMSYLPHVTRGLVARGYRDEQILAILGGNFLRVCTETL